MKFEHSKSDELRLVMVK